MSPGINTARPPWGRDPTMRTSRRDVAGYRHSTASLAQGPQHDEESRPASVRRRILRSRLGIKHGRRGAGTPRCGEADEMSPGIGTARPRWRRDPSMTRRADQGLFVGESCEVGSGLSTAAVGQGPHVAEEATRCRREKTQHGRRGVGTPRCGGGNEMSPGNRQRERRAPKRPSSFRSEENLTEL